MMYVLTFIPQSYHVLCVESDALCCKHVVVKIQLQRNQLRQYGGKKISTVHTLIVYGFLQCQPFIINFHSCNKIQVLNIRLQFTPSSASVYTIVNLPPFKVLTCSCNPSSSCLFFSHLFSLLLHYQLDTHLLTYVVVSLPSFTFSIFLPSIISTSSFRTLFDYIVFFRSMLIPCVVQPKLQLYIVLCSKHNEALPYMLQSVNRAVTY